MILCDLLKLLNLIGCFVNIKDEFLKKKSLSHEADSLHISHIASTGKRNEYL